MNRRISAISIKAYKNMRLPASYWQKAKYPSENRFNFLKINSIVKIEPLSSVLPPKAVDVICKNARLIEPGGCYYNAPLAASWLYEIGVGVNCVDGYCWGKDGGDVFRHRFCEYQGRFFDVTLETLFGYEHVQRLVYRAVRQFSLFDAIAIAFASTSFEKGELGVLWQSTLCPDINRDIPSDINLSFIDDSGAFCPFPLAS